MISYCAFSVYSDNDNHLFADVSVFQLYAVTVYKHTDIRTWCLCWTHFSVQETANGYKATLTHALLVCLIVGTALCFCVMSFYKWIVSQMFCTVVFALSLILVPLTVFVLSAALCIVSTVCTISYCLHKLAWSLVLHLFLCLHVALWSWRSVLSSHCGLHLLYVVKIKQTKKPFNELRGFYIVLFYYYDYILFT